MCGVVYLSYLFVCIYVEKYIYIMIISGKFCNDDCVNSIKFFFSVFRILYEPGFLGQEEAADLFDTLLLETQWNKKDIMIRGEYYPQPRLVAWYGPFPYSYSGVTLEAAEV